MYCGCGTTYGDDFRFYRHVWWCSSDCMAVALHLSLLALRGTYATGISPPMARKFDSSFTHGDSFGFPSHLWRYPSDGIAEAPRLSLPAIHGTHATGTSPPMARNSDSGFTHGDGFGFRRHPWRYSSDRTAAAPRLSLLAVRSTRTTGVSPPMEMTFDCGFTHGGGLGFRRHLWRSPADGVAKAPPSSLSALLGPAARRKSPPLETNLGGNSTDGDDVRLDRRLWRGHLGQRLTRLAISRRTES